MQSTGTSNVEVVQLDLANIENIQKFAEDIKERISEIDCLVCNAGVWYPMDLQAKTDDGFEANVGVNHLGHFLLVNLLLDDMSRAKGARVCIVGSITGNSNTVGGGLVYPRAELGDLEGFAEGGVKPVAMVDGKPFFGAKAYKDSKICNMMTILYCILMEGMDRQYIDKVQKRDCLDNMTTQQ